MSLDIDCFSVQYEKNDSTIAAGIIKIKNKKIY